MSSLLLRVCANFVVFVHDASELSLPVFVLVLKVSSLYGLNGTGQGRGLLKWDYDGKK